jgi:hypothetical protein
MEQLGKGIRKLISMIGWLKKRKLTPAVSTDPQPAARVTLPNQLGRS